MTVLGNFRGRLRSAVRPLNGRLRSVRPAGGRRIVRRLAQLYVGLVLYGLSMALMIESTLGLNPWDVFHQGLSKLTGLSIGTITILVGALVLLLWIPLRQRPGLGTISNVVVIGLAVDAALGVLPTAASLPTRIGLLLAGIVLNGVATGLYIGARFGPGPRDGLMTGYVAIRPGRSLRLVRTVIELTVLGVGWLLGGTVGVGTVAYAVAIGPLAHLFIPMFTVPSAAPPTAATPTAAPPTAATPTAATPIVERQGGATLPTGRTSSRIGNRAR